MSEEPRRFLDGFRINPEWNRWYAERRQVAQLRKGELLAAIARISDEDIHLAPFLEHHAPDEDRRYCGGCDMGCNCEAASWPCSTVRLVLEQAGVDTTDMDLIRWKGDL